MKISFKEKAQWWAMRAGMAFAGVGFAGAASAQNAGGGGAGGNAIGGMVNAICSMVRPMVGEDSKVLSLVFLIALGVMIFLWWMSENKEGVITWILRTGLAVGILINLFTLPQLIGLNAVC